MSLPDEDGGIDITEGLRERLLLDEQVHLVTSAQAIEEPSADLAGYARYRWIAGCDRCRANLLRQCALAGFTPKIAFTTDDYVAVQALVAADLGVSILPALALRAARHPGIRTVPLPGARRYVFAVRYGDPPDPPAVSLLLDVLRTAADVVAARQRQHRSATVACVNPGQPPSAEADRQQIRGELESIPGQLTLPGMPSPAELRALDGDGSRMAAAIRVRWTCCSTASTPGATAGTSCTRPRIWFTIVNLQAGHGPSGMGHTVARSAHQRRADTLREGADEDWACPAPGSLTALGRARAAGTPNALRP